MTANQVVRYFRDQKSVAAKKKADNTISQKKNKGKCPSEERSKAKSTIDKNKRGDTRVKNSDPCHNHPKGNHTWGVSFQKKRNSAHKPPNRSEKSEAKAKEANSYSRLLELNDVVSLLPGDEEPLNEKQLKKSCCCCFE
jgi:hypothetical protein